MRRVVQLAAFAASLCAGPAYAAPSGGEAVAGDAGSSEAAASESGTGEAERDAVAFALYERATRELADGEYALAAKHFARADEISPTPAALEAALIAVHEADDAVLGMILVSRTGREPTHEKLGALAARARARFADRVGRLVVTCRDCEASVNGVVIEPGVASWQPLGPAVVTIRSNGRIEERRVTVTKDVIATVRPTGPVAPAPIAKRAPEEATSPTGGVSPAFFWVGVGLTAAAGVGTVVSFVDLKGIHDDFRQTPSAALAEEGDAAQLRTRVLLGVTGGLAVATALVGTLAVDWGGDEEVSVVTDGRTVGWRLRW